MHYLQDKAGVRNIQKLRGESAVHDESVQSKRRSLQKKMSQLRRRRAMQRHVAAMRENRIGDAMLSVSGVRLQDNDFSSGSDHDSDDDDDNDDRGGDDRDEGVVVADDQSAVDESAVRMEYLQLKEALQDMERKTPYVMMFRVLESRLSHVLSGLEEIGVGVEFGIIDVAPLEITRPLLRDVSVDKSGGRKRPIDLAGKRRMTEILHHNILEESSISVDFLLYVLSGAVIAAVGLGTNNVVAVVASMLVSPLMGPIIGYTFGTVTRDIRLIVTALLTELIGVIIVFFCGVFVGIAMSAFSIGLGWPTDEMLSRGTWEAQLIGIAIAIPSGVGVALTITSGGVNPLVGVAISASILPPVTNSGMNLAYALIGPLIHGDAVDHTHHYVISGLSMVLFLLNILCIYVTGLIVFKLKSVRPFRRKASQTFEGFPEYEHAYFDIPRMLRLNANMAPLIMPPPLTRSTKTQNLAALSEVRSAVGEEGEEATPSPIIFGLPQNGREVPSSIMRSRSDDILPKIRVDTDIHGPIRGVLGRTISDPICLNTAVGGEDQRHRHHHHHLHHHHPFEELPVIDDNDVVLGDE